MLGFLRLHTYDQSLCPIFLQWCSNAKEQQEDTALGIHSMGLKKANIYILRVYWPLFGANIPKHLLPGGQVAAGPQRGISQANDRLGHSSDQCHSFSALAREVSQELALLALIGPVLTNGKAPYKGVGMTAEKELRVGMEQQCGDSSPTEAAWAETKGEEIAGSSSYCLHSQYYIYLYLSI